MTIEEKITAILVPVFGDELYPVVHPDPDGLINSVSDLYAIYTKIGGRRFGTLEGDISLCRPRIQISIYSISFAELIEKETAVDAAMQAANALANQCITDGIDSLEVLEALPNNSVTEPTYGHEEDTKRHFIHLEYYAWCRS